MLRLSFATRLALSLVAVMALARPASAAQEVPLKGTLDGTVTAEPINPPIFAIDIDGGGTASQLGRFTVSVPHVVNRATRQATGSYVFTAANGDTLTAEFVGESFPTEVAGVLYIVEVATITGGTGRFAGATGGFTVERLFDTVAGVTSGSFEGTVSSPGAGNH